MDGLAAANRIMAQDTPTAIVLVSAYDDLAFIHSGAERKAYILKNSRDNIPEFIPRSRGCRQWPGGFAQDHNPESTGYLP